jgi:hypothetical protein
MTENTKFKEIIFWLIFLGAAIFIGFWLVNMGQATVLETENIIFIQNIKE